VTLSRNAYNELTSCSQGALASLFIPFALAGIWPWKENCQHWLVNSLKNCIPFVPEAFAFDGAVAVAVVTALAFFLVAGAVLAATGSS
jgi:hypothetical protein